MKTNQKLMALVVVTGIMASCQKQSDTPAANLQNAASQNSLATGTDLSARSVNPADFVTGITNPYFPLEPGTTKYFIKKGKGGGQVTTQHITMDITHDTKVILGVTCEVIHDYVKENGIVTEDTYDWYAQDNRGNVWYFGEATQKLTDTGWSTAGSWEAGVDGAQQGIIMYAHAGGHLGETYYQEYYVDVAEDQATLLSNTSTVNIRLGNFIHCVETQEFSRLLPGDVTKKSYAPGLGEIRAESVPPGAEIEELVAIKKSR